MTNTQELVDFISNELLHAEGAVDAETPILELGILDSLSMVSLLTFIHTRFGFPVPDCMVLPEHFETPAALARLLDTLKPGSRGTVHRTEAASPLLESVRILQSSGVVRQKVPTGDGSWMHVLRVAGGRPTFVLLPGLGNPSSSWGPMMRSLAGENQTIAVDFAGFGLSESAKERPTWRDHVETTLEVLERIAKPPLVLVGSSAGSMIATEIARRHPEWISALIVSGFGLIKRPEKWWDRIAELSRTPEQFLEAAYYRPPTLNETLNNLIHDVMSRPAYHSFLDDGGLEAMKFAFDGLQVPTLLVAGEEDGIVPRAAVLAAAEASGARITWLARCGHFPSAEQPEELLYVIRNFLSLTNAGHERTRVNTNGARCNTQNVLTLS